MERNISKINDFFLELEFLIGGQPNDSEVDKKFREGKELIDELEGINEKQHGLFRYKYHTRYADYIKKRGDVENASRHENLAKKYEKFNEPSRETYNYRTDFLLFTNVALEDNEKTSYPDEKCAREAVEEELEKIQSILRDEVVELFRQNFNKLFNDTPKSFLDFQNVIDLDINLRKLADNPISEELFNLEQVSPSDKEKIEQIRKNLLTSLNVLRELSRGAAYLKRIGFMQQILNSPDKEAILFSNILFTKEEIYKRFRELSLYFHPDKTNQPNTPYWLDDKHKELGAKLFEVAVKFKETLLMELEEVSRAEGFLTFHEKKANMLWKISIDYRNAAKGQWNKLKILDTDDVKGSSSAELEHFSIGHGELAYYEYRAACKIADNSKYLKKQVELRGSMALCLFVTKKYIEAQLYALSAIQLLLKNSQDVTSQDLITAEKIFNKVKGGNATKENTEVKSEGDLNSELSCVNAEGQIIPIFEKKTYRRSIEEDMSKLSWDLVIPDQSLVRYYTSEKEIMRAKIYTYRHRVKGTAYIVGSVANAFCTIMASAVFGPIGVIAFGLGMCSITHLWKEGNILLNEPEARKNLNRILTKAIEAYDKDEYQKFYEALSEEYEEDTSLLKLEKPEDTINPKEIIKLLIRHGFRSDGIAYLLNLLGVVIGSGRIRIIGITPKKLRMMAESVFYGVLNDELLAEAKKLDKRARAFQNEYSSIINKKFIFTIMDFFSNKDYSGIVQDYINNGEEMPFQSRLEEMRNVAKLNIAIINILDTGVDEIIKATEMLKDIRNSIYQNYQFSGMVKQRLEAVEDLLWIICGEELAEKTQHNKISLICP
ncbi:12346_t:CDS:1 [Acaulospora morrowiae]|uniref:12346_t:CDS:1 n=1 Tax=Acaulospora morrowiae TaxID=94023 RepID=A0A9N8WH72_9GLOM|nr:12346_t:CDS:1 [Acaulospora morrowiae]